MSDLEYVALAYGVIWLGLLGYLLRLSLRQEHLRREVRLLEQMLRAEELPTEEDEREPSLSAR